MSLFLRIIISFLTFLTFAAVIYFMFVGIKMGVPILIVTCALLTAAFGVFVYADIRYWLYKIRNKK